MGIKVKAASLSKGYYYDSYLQHKPGLECEITGDTTEEEALDMLENILDKWHTKKTSGTPFEKLKPETSVTSSIVQTEKSDPNDTLALIQNAPALEILKTFKLLSSTDKTLYEAYCTRIKELA